MAAAGDRENMIGDIPQKIAAFYSPQGGSGKTILAYSCALALCKKRYRSLFKSGGVWLYRTFVPGGI